jgi:ribosomal protein L11 methyltransferase
LIEVAPKIAASIAPGGWLVFSGVLREQEAEVVAALEKQRLRVEQIVRKGKWIAGVARPGQPARRQSPVAKRS